MSATLTESKRLYHLGLTDDCPIHRAVVGNQVFVRFTEKVSKDGNATVRVPIVGDYQRLSAADVDLIKERAKDLVVRVFKDKDGKVSQAHLESKSSKGFSNSEDHVPVANYIYILLAKEDPHVKVTTPKPLSEMKG
jgi:hypothetical protein